MEFLAHLNAFTAGCLIGAVVGGSLGALFMACVACCAQSDLAEQHAAERRKWTERARLLQGGHDA